MKPQKATGSETRDKLLPDEWSVPIKNSVGEMISSQPGFCLVSTSEAKTLVEELKGDHALAILEASNIDGTGE